MNQEVVVLPYNPAWATMFEDEAHLILAALGPNAIAAHHIGSTAIPAMIAKPIIDMLVVVADIELVDTHNGDMAALGYQALGDYGIPTRRFFRKNNRWGIRTHHAHVFPQSSDHVRRHLSFRDFMNTHPQWAMAYAELKQELASKHPHSFEDYHHGKSEFITNIDRLAAAWHRGETSSQP